MKYKESAIKFEIIDTSQKPVKPPKQYVVYTLDQNWRDGIYSVYKRINVGKPTSPWEYATKELALAEARKRQIQYYKDEMKACKNIIKGSYKKINNLQKKLKQLEKSK